MGRHAHNWKGGRVIASNGYVLVFVGKGKPLADVRGYAYEHRLVAAQKFGRLPTQGEHVHHINGDKADNRPENLELLTAPEHHFEHRVREAGLRRPNEPNSEVSCACGCGRTFARFDASGRPREYLPGHNPHDAPTLNAVVAVLSAGPQRRPAIVAAVGRTKHAVAVALTKLKHAGIATNDHGTWRKVG